MKEISKIIKEFEKFPYKCYVRKRTKHELTKSYFYLEKQLAKCMMRADAFNFQVDPVRIEMTGSQHITILQVCFLDDSESKGIIADKNLS